MTGIATSDYITNQLHFYWFNINNEWEEYKKWIKWLIHQNPKKNRVVKFIISEMTYERYQINLVELSRELNMNGKFKLLLTKVDHFSKYDWALPIKNKDAVTVRNTIAQVFIRGYPRKLQTDNGKEFFNKVLSAYLDSIEVEHLLGAPYHSQSQGAIEAFNKTIQKELSKTYDNTKKDENENFDLELNLYQFLHYYNWKRQHTTTWQIPKHVMDNLNDQNIRKIVSLAT